LTLKNYLQLNNPTSWVGIDAQRAARFAVLRGEYAISTGANDAERWLRGATSISLVNNEIT
jgi:hypothetical protein